MAMIGILVTQDIKDKNGNAANGNCNEYKYTINKI
jgi:hypothetical protein